MKRIAYILSISFILLMTTAIVAAANVGIYIQQENEDPTTHCVEVDNDATGYETLSELDDFQFEEIEDSHVICESGDDENFVCSQSAGNSLRVIMQVDDGWQADAVPSLDAGDDCYNPATFDIQENFPFYSFISFQFLNIHYCASDGDVLGVFTEEIPTGQPEAPDADYTPTFEEICEPLFIDKATGYVDGNKEGDLDEDGGEIEDAYPGALIELKIKLENIALEDLDEEITDIRLTGTLEDVDGEDIEYESSDFKLDPEDSKTVTLEFQIPLTAEEDTYDLLLEVEGEDDDGFLYEYEVDFEVKVRKEKHKLVLQQLTTLDSELCEGTTERLQIGVINAGSSDEDAVLTMSIREFNIEESMEFEVPEVTRTDQKSIRKTFSFDIPENADDKAIIDIILEYGSEETDLEIPIIISDCEASEEETTEVKTVTVQKNVPTVTGMAVKPKSTLEGYFLNTVFIALAVLTVVAVILILMIIRRK